MNVEQMVQLKEDIAATIFEYGSDELYIRPTERACHEMADMIMELLSDRGELPLDNQVLEVKNPEDEECSDFILTGNSCWIEANGLVAYVIAQANGMTVEILPANIDDDALQSPLDSAFAHYPGQ